MEGETPQLRLYFEDAEAVNELFRQALAKKGKGAFRDFLAFVERFSRFSIFNALLIHVQRPGATAVGSRTQWRRYHRSVNADAVPIVVLRPFGPVEFVYELKDTAGPPVPGEEADPFRAFGRVPPTSWERTVAAGRKCGIGVEEVDNYGGGLAGTATILHDSEHGGETLPVTGEETIRWRVRVNKRLEPPARFLTLAHELAHVYCGHLGEDRRGRWPNRWKLLTQSQRELEAETAAWLVCRRAGIDTRSAEYLSEKVKEDDLGAIDFFAIMAAAHRIEARGEKEDSSASGGRRPRWMPSSR